MKYVSSGVLFLLLCNMLPAQVAAVKTKVVLLGTGTPFADPDRSGPSVAIVVNNVSYVIDCGPGVVSPRICRR
ncbi:MAG: hypothetical protein ABI581_16615 [Sediminibacterium sp.]